MAKPSPAAVALLVGRMKKASTPKDEESAPSAPSDMGLSAAAEEAMQAVRDGDADAFAAAMKSFVHMCTSGGYPEEADEGEA